MKTRILVFAILMGNLAYSQDKQIAFEAHRNLIGGVWKIDTNWEDGSPYKISVTYESTLGGTILKTRTYGNISRDSIRFGLRNEGIRYIDGGDIRFYEFDIFGGTTKGDVRYVDRNIYYSYVYATTDNKVTLTDGWEYIDKDTYDFTVGIYDPDNNKWEKKFLSSKIRRFKNE